MLRRDFLKYATGAVAVPLISSSVFAQAYPTRQIRLVVPFAAGGPTDIVARIIGQYISDALRVQVVIENRIGAGGTVATTHVKNAAPDGYTIMMGHMGTHACSVSLYPNLAYDPINDFRPIGMAAGTPILVLARRNFPPTTLAEFVAYVRANASRLNMAHAGVGSVSHATGLLLNSIIGVKPTQVPFGGTGPALQAMVGGQVDYLCDQIVSAISHVQAGSIKVYAIGTTDRNPMLPNVPTTNEAGMPTFEVSAWNALFAPRGVPQDTLDILSDALDRALDDAGVRKRLLDLGSEIPEKAGRGQRPLAAKVESEIARWRPILKS